MYRIHRNTVWLTRASRIYKKENYYSLSTDNTPRWSVGRLFGWWRVVDELRGKSEQQHQPMRHTAHRTRTARRKHESNWQKKVFFRYHHWLWITMTIGPFWVLRFFPSKWFGISIHPFNIWSPLHALVLFIIIKSLFFRLSTAFEWKGKIKWKSYNRRTLDITCTVVCIIILFIICMCSVCPLPIYGGRRDRW